MCHISILFKYLQLFLLTKQKTTIRMIQIIIRIKIREIPMMKKRNINLDIIRSIAVFSVLSVHFFLNNGFYTEIIKGKRMFVMFTMRTAFMICVPLFAILTGYLMNKKILSKTYYFITSDAILKNMEQNFLLENHSYCLWVF